LALNGTIGSKIWKAQSSYVVPSQLPTRLFMQQGGVEGLLDRQTRPERRNHSRHSRRFGFGDTDMPARVIERAQN
jgi:hypothetical protein